MSVTIVIVGWAALVVILAGRGLKRLWLAALLAFPLVCLAVFALDPSLQGVSGDKYRAVATIVGGVLWVGAGLASLVAWFIGSRARASSSGDSGKPR